MHVVVTTSGGIDSTTTMALRLHSGTRVVAVTLDYGQRNVQEIHAAQSVIEWFNNQPSITHPVEHIIIGASNLGPALAWRSPTTLEQLEPLGDGDLTFPVVPNRNMIIASIAGGIAEACGASEVVLGVHTGRPQLPDCTPGFLDDLNRCLRSSTDGSVSASAPFIRWDKRGIIRVAAKLNAPLHLTWSCYRNGIRHCGQCRACVNRRRGFDDAGVPDPTVYSNSAEVS